MPIPLLILSDSPSGLSGLGRITRELALRIHEHLGDVFEVATYGLGAEPSPNLPFKQYSMKTESAVPTNLPQVWRDFAGERQGVLFSVFNVTWTPWLADPEKFAKGALREFLLTQPFMRWTYTPIDADVRLDRLALNMAEALCGFDRVMHYTEWAKKITDNAIAAIHPKRNVGSVAIPHGIDRSVFYKRDRLQARETLYQRVTGGDANPIRDGITLVGAVGTNTARKYWPLAFEVCEHLIADGHDVGLWCHVDHARKHYDLLALVREFGLEDRVIFSNRNLSDDEMAWAYSACDVTIGLAPEGFGYAPFESIACGTPCVVGDYAACGEFVEPQFKVRPLSFVHDGFFNSRRPVYLASEFSCIVRDAIGQPCEFPDELDWVNLWPRFEQWFLEGVA